MRPTLRIPAKCLCVLWGLATASLTSPARAADSSWNVDNAAPAPWATATNWVGSIVPGTTGTTDNVDKATFGNVTTAPRTVTVDAGRNIKDILFDGNTFGYTLSGGSLVLTNGGSIVSNGSGTGVTNIVSSAIAIQGDGGTATFTSSSTEATNVLNFGAVTGVSSAGNTTLLTLTGVNTGTNTMTGVIGNGAGGGTLGVVKTGTGNWTLSASNTFTGGLAIRAGTLTALNSVTSLGAAANTLTLGDTTGSSFASLLIGFAGTYAQPIVLAAGTTGALRIETAANLTTGNLTFSGGITGTNNLAFANKTTAGTTTFSGALNFTGTMTFASTSTGTTTLSGALGANAAIEQNSLTSMLSLTNANPAFAGGITVTQGIVNVTNATGLGTGAILVQSGGALQFGNTGLTTTPTLNLNGNGPDGKGALRSTATGTNPQYSGPIVLGSNSSIAAATNTTTSGNLKLSGVISGNHNLTVVSVYNPAGTAGTTANVAFNNGANTFGGVGKFLTVNDGMLTAGVASVNTATSGILGHPDTTLVLGNPLVVGSPVVNMPFVTGGLTVVNPITIASGTGTRTLQAGAGHTLTGPITLDNKDLTIIMRATTATFSLSGGISGTGSVFIDGDRETNVALGGTINHAGAITYTSASNTQPKLTISGNLGANVGLVSFSAPGGTIGGSGQLSGLTLGGNNANTNGVSATGPLSVLILNSPTALGAAGNVLTMATGFLNNTTGSLVTVANATIINNNTDFTFIGTQGLDLGAATFNVNGSRTITLQNTALARALTLGNVVGTNANFTATGSTGTNGFLTVNGTLGIGSGNVAVTGGATLTLNNAANPFTGTVTIGGGTTAGTLAFAVASAAGVAGSLGQQPTNAAVNLVFNGTAATLRYVGTTAGSTNRNFTLTTDGLLEASGTGGITFAGSPALTDARTLSLGGTSVGTAAGTYSGLLADGGGTLSIIKVNTGTWILANANTYTGATSVLRGTLLAGADAPSGAAGAFGNSTVPVIVGDTVGANTATLLTNGAYTIGRDITVQAGSTGTATLGGNAAAASSFTGNITLNKNVQITQAAGGVVTFGTGTISGTSFGINKVGAGTVVLGAANTYTGTTTITQGALYVNGSTAAGSGVSIAAGTTLGGFGTVNGTLTLPATAFTLAPGAPTSPGTLQLTAANTVLTMPTGSTLVSQFGGAVAQTPDGVAVPAQPTAGQSDTDAGAAPVAKSLLSLTGIASSFSANSPVINIVDNGTITLTNTNNYSFTLATGTSPAAITGTPTFNVTGTGTAFANYAAANGGSSAFSLTTSGNSVYLNLTATPIPEPFTVLGSAVLGWLALSRGRRALRLSKL